MLGKGWVGCRVLGKGRAGRGGMESGKGTCREREGEGSNARRLLTRGQDAGWREEPDLTSPVTGLATRGDCEDPTEAPWAGRVGTGWGVAGTELGWGFGQEGVGFGQDAAAHLCFQFS